MKAKILNVCLILTSLIGYLEWGNNNSMFLLEGEIEVISKLFNDPTSVMHPFTLLPLTGQILLLITLFQKSPGKWLTFIGLGGISVLLLFMLYISIISLNYKIALSTLPFLFTGFLVIRHRRK